jgi:spore germination cell wall hydrolase CwlJ-like protein
MWRQWASDRRIGLEPFTTRRFACPSPPHPRKIPRQPARRHPDRPRLVPGVLRLRPTNRGSPAEMTAPTAAMCPMADRRKGIGLGAAVRHVDQNDVRCPARGVQAEVEPEYVRALLRLAATFSKPAHRVMQEAD